MAAKCRECEKLTDKLLRMEIAVTAAQKHEDEMMKLLKFWVGIATKLLEEKRKKEAP